MAESFAFTIAGKLLEKLGNLALEGICLAWGVQSELEKLKDTLADIKSVLLDAEEKQTGNHELSRWLEKLKDAFYEVEDLLDEFEIQGLKRQVLKRGSTGRKVLHFFSSSNAIAFRFRMGQKIKKAKEMLDRTVADKAKFDLDVKPETRSVMYRETYSFVNTSKVIGRQEDKETIMTYFLMHPTEEEDIAVLPIVGIGGLGKTTLAQLLYNDEKVKSHFELKLWVCVSEDFDIRNLMIKMVESDTGKKCGDMNKQGLHKVLQDCLNGKRYLLILDDVWNNDKKKWIELKDLLNLGARGSKIIVTTRSNQVATITGTIPQYDLQKLSDEDALSLFLQFAFTGGEEKQHPNLVKIGEEIVRKCKGVALAVKTLGSLLCLTTAEHDWKAVRDNEIWKLEQRENDILPALKLSYDHLPLHLRQCFAYCSIFPKDFLFADYDLISFWMAHGLLQSSDKNEEPEDIGKRYINELCSRSFFQEVNDCFWFVSFRMHDLLHDLALLVAQNEVNSFDQTLSPTVRHLWADYNLLNLEGSSSDIVNKSGRVRTFRFYHVNEECQSHFEICTSKSKQLRALDLQWCSSEELPASVCNLKHLRYFGIEINEKIKKLPNSLCSLQSLQTLILLGREGIEELASDIRYMISLRTLEITTRQSVLQKNGIGCLTSLRYLIFHGCENLKYLFEDMQSLKALRTLIIWECNNLVSLPQSLKCLTALETLVIWRCDKLDLSVGQMEFGGEEKEEDGSLRKLWIGGIPKLEALPPWILLGSTKTIQRLWIIVLENLSTLPAWLQHLISLQELRIESCPMLSYLPQGLQHLTSLKTFFIEGCHSLSESCKPETGKDWPKIAHVPTIYLP